MLDVDVLEFRKGVSYGHETLNSLQNENLPELDLLVREAIQNSSDAAYVDDGEVLSFNETYFNVYFNTGKFDTYSINSYFTGIVEELRKRHPGEEADFLEIRDSNTSGLTGKIREDEINPNEEDHGNYFKLIFDAGKKQIKEGAGGNWGHGKSVYYRVGSGIVIFYSRIKAENGYESRMIFTLIENEENPDAILKTYKSKSVGKAWWGKKEGVNLLPITDENEIKQVLDCFKVRSEGEIKSIQPFGETETGTSVIIPYIDKDYLMANVLAQEADLSPDMRERCSWFDSMEKYLNEAIQAWYAPKIQNLALKDFSNKKFLRVFLNNVPIKKDSMFPFFKAVQELYTIATAKTYGKTYTSTLIPEAMCMPVSIRDYFNTAEDNSIAGYVAMARVSAELFENQHFIPYALTRHFEEINDNKNAPIVMYSREPGMVIEYATTVNKWTKNIVPPDNADEFLIAFFAPNTEKRIKASLAVKEYAGEKLGKYLRNCESSDHMGWKDKSDMQIVERIQKNTVTQIMNQIRTSSDSHVEATASKLSGRLGRMFLPMKGYANQGGRPGPVDSVNPVVKLHNIGFAVVSQTLSRDSLILECSLQLKNGKKDATLEVIIGSEGEKIDAEDWGDEIGTVFPIQVSQVKLLSIESNMQQVQMYSDAFCVPGKPKYENEKIEIQLLPVGKMGSITKVQIKSHIQNPVIRMEMMLKTLDKTYSAVITAV